MIRYNIIVLLIGFLSISCILDKPTFCKSQTEIVKIVLTPTKSTLKKIGGKKVEIKNDSVIDFIAKEICSIDRTKSHWATGDRIFTNKVDIDLQSSSKKSFKLSIGYHSSSDRYYLLEGKNNYFEHDELCEFVASLTHTYVKSMK